MTTSEYSSELAAALDRLLPSDGTIRADWTDVIERVGRSRRSTSLIRKRPLRIALAVVAVFLVLAAVATAAHLIQLALAAQPPPLVVALDDTGRLRPVWSCRQPTADGCGAFVRAAALAPDGRRLALVTGSQNDLSLYQGGIHVIDLEAGSDRHLPASTAHPSSPAEQLAAWRRLGPAASRLLGCAEPHELAWSPDSALLAYACPGRIYVVRPDGTGRRLLRTGTARAYWPTWSPDGSRIAFSTESTPLHSTIYAVDLDGTHRTLVTRAGAAPDWSPDGTTIAYWAAACTGRRNRDGRTRLVTPDGRDVTPHTTGRRCGGIGPTYARPAWSPDGHRLAIESWNGLFVMDADGSHVHAIRGTDSGTFGDTRPLWRPHR